ncbi:DUF4238 domain-containing protein [Actinosynnema sp. NPDC023587]|uniref:DUF4238 domain-containing protein n=1 Tax=Actinosynnema sp. NPDC023587 TaxID=3154695 RepID=UPI00340BAD40
MVKRVRRQHVVSKFYLKGFADEAGQLRRVYLPGDRSHLMAISDATVVKDFYTVTLPDDSESDMFERAFGGIEAAASEALRAAIGGVWPLQRDVRGGLASWLALQHLRGENIRASSEQQQALTIRLIVGVSGKQALRVLIERAEQRTLSDAELDWEWQDVTKPGGPDLKSNADAHLLLLMSLHDDMSRYLQDSHWTILRFKRRSLLTTDNPVVMAVRPDDSGRNGIGIFTADAFLAPLSRYAALMMQPRHKLPIQGVFVPDFDESGSTTYAHWINQELVWHARRHIYMHPDDLLSDKIRLPQPDRRNFDANIGGALISEGGLFHGLSEDQLKDMSEAMPPRRNEDGMTINDLEWPIPGRMTSGRPTSW